MQTNKPSWAEAPEWAQYLMQDADGDWWWFSRAERAAAGTHNPDMRDKLDAVPANGAVRNVSEIEPLPFGRGFRFTYQRRIHGEWVDCEMTPKTRAGAEDLRRLMLGSSDAPHAPTPAELTDLHEPDDADNMVFPGGMGSD